MTKSTLQHVLKDKQVNNRNNSVKENLSENKFKAKKSQLKALFEI